MLELRTCHTWLTIWKSNLKIVMLFCFFIFGMNVLKFSETIGIVEKYYDDNKNVCVPLRMGQRIPEDYPTSFYYSV